MKRDTFFGAASRASAGSCPRGGKEGESTIIDGMLAGISGFTEVGPCDVLERTELDVGTEIGLPRGVRSKTFFITGGGLSTLGEERSMVLVGVARGDEASNTDDVTVVLGPVPETSSGMAVGFCTIVRPEFEDEPDILLVRDPEDEFGAFEDNEEAGGRLLGGLVGGLGPKLVSSPRWSIPSRSSECLSSSSSLRSGPPTSFPFSIFPVRMACRTREDLLPV
jgi:hypothetical protein